MSQADTNTTHTDTVTVAVSESSTDTILPDIARSGTLPKETLIELIHDGHIKRCSIESMNGQQLCPSKAVPIDELHSTIEDHATFNETQSGDIRISCSIVYDETTDVPVGVINTILEDNVRLDY